MTTTAAALTPGIYHDLAEQDYHADPALSSTGAKTLLPPGCPARYRWNMDHGRPPKRAFDVGSAAHRQVLGVGDDVTVIDAPDYRSKAAREARDDARAAGNTPVLAAEWDQVQAMAEALRADAVAAALLDPDTGTPEVSIVWDDPATAVRCRARIDFLPHPDARSRLIVTDYKTTGDASPDACSRSIGQYRYHIQEAWYVEAVAAAHALDPDDIAFVFVFQEKDPPYLVSVCELDWQARHAGRHAAARAREIFAECTATGTWPGYSTRVEPIELKPWVLRESEQL